MKNILSFLSLSLALIITNCTAPQQAAASFSTESIKVRGVCNMCKKRIETAAFAIAGVKTATWSAKNQALEVSYDAKKATKEAIQKRIAATGHDTEKLKADNGAYAKLPACCKYRDGVEMHDN